MDAPLSHFHGEEPQRQAAAAALVSCGNSRAAGDTPSVIAYGDATFPKGTAFRIAAKLPSSQKASPSGELALRSKD